MRFMPDQARRRREAAADARHVARAHPSGVLRGHRVGRGRRSTSPTPWTSTPPCRSARPGWPTSARPPPLDVRRSEALGEMARHQLALDLDTTGDTGDPDTAATPARRRPAGGAARPPLRGRDHHPGRPVAPGPGGEHPLLRRRRAGPRLVRPPGHHGDGEAGGRPGRAPPRRPVPGPRPARRPGHRTRPDVCVPVVHPPRRGVRPGPRHPLQRGRTDGERQPRRRCAGGTTGSRPTTPAGATRCWSPGPTCGHSPHGYQFLRDHRGTTDVTRDRATHPPDE